MQKFLPKSGLLVLMSSLAWLGFHSATSASRTGELNAGQASVLVDWETRFQKMDGFGSSVRVFDDPHVFDNFDRKTGRALTVMRRPYQDQVLDALYLDLGLTRLRPIYEGNEAERHNDNADPDRIDPAGFEFSWKRNDAYLDLARRAEERGATTVYPTSITFQDWLGGESRPEEAAELIVARILRWRQLGIELDYYSVINEPGYRRGGFWSGEFIRDVVKIAGPWLRKNKLETKFVVPDDWGPGEAYERSRVILADPDARKYIGALAYHLYSGSAEDLNNMKALGEQYDLPVWMTEYSPSDKTYWRRFYGKRYDGPLDWAILIDDMVVKYGVSAIDYMWGFFGQWEKPSTNLLRLKYSGPLYQGFERGAEYFATRQYSRFVRPGARRSAAESSDPDIRVSAFEGDEGWTIVLLNTGAVPKQAEVRFQTGGPADETVFRATRTTKADMGATLPPVAVQNSGFDADLPPGSITTFSTLKFEGGKAVRVVN